MIWSQIISGFFQGPFNLYVSGYSRERRELTAVHFINDKIYNFTNLCKRCTFAHCCRYYNSYGAMFYFAHYCVKTPTNHNTISPRASFFMWSYYWLNVILTKVNISVNININKQILYPNMKWQHFHELSLDVSKILLIKITKKHLHKRYAMIVAQAMPQERFQLLNWISGHTFTENSNSILIALPSILSGMKICLTAEDNNGGNNTHGYLLAWIPLTFFMQLI